ncbi:MAG: VacJ family lipoprotein [Alphaproteobacteria bacterium]
MRRKKFAAHEWSGNLPREHGEGSKCVSSMGRYMTQLAPLRAFGGGFVPRRIVRVIASLAVAGMIALGGCATPPVDDPDAMAEYERANDPLEPLNRGVFKFNLFLDQLILRPLSEVYVWLFPVEFRDSLHNMLSNADEPVNFANALLQGKGRRAGTALARLIINTTLGVGGMIDVASDLGFEPIEEDFGQTLAVWGISDGPYMMLPILGPATVRDGVGRGVDIFLDPMTYIINDIDNDYVGPGILAATAIDLPSRNLATLDEIERTSVDFYAAIRSLYRQRREDLINNGQQSEDSDPFISDDFDY